MPTVEIVNIYIYIYEVPTVEIVNIYIYEVPTVEIVRWVAQ